MNEFWLPAEWQAPPGIRALTTLRGGGASAAPFDSLNLAAHVGDDPLKVLENRRRIREELLLPGEPVWLEQVHGTRVVQADALQGLEQADAAFTTVKGVVCAVLIADCLPLLLCTQAGSAVAAVHAGWRGLLHGVIENAVAALPPEPLYAWLGPAIGAQRFEVGDEVHAAFIAKTPLYGAAFKAVARGKWLADIYCLARLALRTLGVDAVYGGGYCTVSDSARFFSYRRDGRTGRMATLIWIA
ncbi:MAG: peptidoglycan editing factor PgeF [Gammaproteobacteria bacterium]